MSDSEFQFALWEIFWKMLEGLGSRESLNILGEIGKILENFRKFGKFLEKKTFLENCGKILRNFNRKFGFCEN